MLAGLCMVFIKFSKYKSTLLNLTEIINIDLVLTLMSYLYNGTDRRHSSQTSNQ